MTKVIESGIRKRINFPISALGIFGDELKAATPEYFRLRKTKLNGVWRKVVWLHFSNRFSLNLSIDTGVFPLNKAEALRYCIQYAKDHGFKPKIFIKEIRNHTLRAVK